jgi:hypothetical protein
MEVAAGCLTKDAEERLQYLQSLPAALLWQCEVDPAKLRATVAKDPELAEVKVWQAFEYVRARIDVDRGESQLDRALAAAEKDQFARLGVSAADLRTYLEVAVDLEDAAYRAERPKISAERSRVYRRVADLLEKGHSRTEKEQAWLQGLVDEEVVNLPWPTPFVRDWLKRRGIKTGRFQKKEATMYDQVWLLWC